MSFSRRGHLKDLMKDYLTTTKLQNLNNFFQLLFAALFYNCTDLVFSSPKHVTTVLPVSSHSKEYKVVSFVVCVMIKTFSCIYWVLSF